MMSMSEELDQVKLDNVVLKCHLAVLRLAQGEPLYGPVLKFLKSLHRPDVPQAVVREMRDDLERLVGLRK